MHFYEMATPGHFPMNLLHGKEEKSLFCILILNFYLRNLQWQPVLRKRLIYFTLTLNFLDIYQIKRKVAFISIDLPY